MPIHQVELTDEQHEKFEQARQKLGLDSIGDTIQFLMKQRIKDMEPFFTGSRSGPKLAVNNTRRKAPNK